MNPEFEVHQLNYIGLMQADEIVGSFDRLLEDLKLMCGEGRYMAIVRTKLEEACFFAKKAVATDTRNQQEKK